MGFVSRLLRIVPLIPLCIACEGIEEDKEKVEVLPNSAGTTVLYVGEPATFSGRAELVSLTCRCQYHGDNRPMGCGFDADTCDSQYDLGAPNPEVCREDEREEVEIERVESTGGGDNCTVEVHVNGDEVSYSGTITCTRTGSISMTVTIWAADGAGSGRHGFEVRRRQ